MGNIVYKTGDMFMTEVKNPIFTHACNAMGVWGSGVAAQFATECFDEYKVYQAMCARNGPIAGYGYTIMSRVGVLVTSVKYGSKDRDPVDKILANTASALPDLFLAMKSMPNHTIVSPKINSGLFGVPWEETEKLIEHELYLNPGVSWIVYSI